MNIELKDKNGITLKTAGKYCSSDVGIIPKLQSKSVATNGSVVADEGYCGLDSVTVDVPATPTQEKTVDLAMASGDQVIPPDSGYDLSKVTVKKPSTLVAGNIKTGVSIGGVTGTLEAKKEEEAKTVDLNMASGNQTINPTSGKVLSQVVVKKPATMLPENIKKDVNIGGVTGTLEIGGGGELNIAYGDTAPEDTSKLWIKSEEPSNISFPVVWKPEQIVEGITDTGATLPTAANSIGTAAVGTKIYLFGGYGGGGYLNTIQVFDTTNNTIQTLSAKLPTAESGIGTAAVGTKIYLFGGSSNAIRVFDTTNNTIQTLSTILPTAANDIGTAAVGTKIYLFGGLNKNGGGYLNTIQVFDTTNNTIQTLSAKLPTAESGIGTAAVGTKIYLFGGYGNSGQTNAIRVFDTTNNTIQTLSTILPTAVGWLATAAVGTKIYLFGGSSNPIQVFDTTNNTIQTLSTILPTAANSIGTAAVGTKIYLFGGYGGGGYLNTINQFIVDVPLSSNDIIVTQEYYARTFKIMKAPTEVEVAVKYVYKGDQNLAKFIDAYLYDGANWVNVNTGDFTFTKLYAPKISVSGKTLTITNDGRNGSKVTNYKVYNGSTLLTTITATTLDLTTVITANGTYNISVIATGTGYTESDSSNVIEYNYGVYNITTNLTGVTANASNPTTVSTLASSTLTFTANPGYNLPDNVTVTGAEHTWTKSSGTLVLSNPTGTVSVTVAGVAISYTITPTLNNVTAASGNATTIATGEKKVLTYTAEDGYALPDPDTVTVTGATGVWDKDAGTLTLSNPTGNVTFTIAGVKVAAAGYTLSVTTSGDGGNANITYVDGTSNWVSDGNYSNVVSINDVTYNMGGSQSYTIYDSENNTHDIPYTLTSNTSMTIHSLCLTGDMLITLADGSQKRIDEITLDDKVLSYNPETMRLEEDTITYCDSDEVKTDNKYDVWTFSDGTIVKTVHRHRLYNVERQAMTYMDEWKIGEHAINIDGAEIELISHEVVEQEVRHFTIFTENQNYFVNGLLSGNRHTKRMNLPK